MSKLQDKIVNRLCILEMYERFSYYGMRSLLVLYMVKIFGFEEGNAYIVYGLYASICYFVPVIGGLLADRYLGYKNLLMSGSILMFIGLTILAISEASTNSLYAGMALVAIGMGFFKGNVSTMLGSIFDKGDINGRDNGYRKFYIMINIGSFIASISCGTIAHLYGWNYAFGFAATGMFVCFITLSASRGLLKEHGNPINSSRKKMKIYIPLGYILSLLVAAGVIVMFHYANTSITIISVLGVLVIVHLAYITSKLQKKERRGIYLVVIMLLFFMSMFALEMHIGSFINLFTDKHVNKNVLGIIIPTASLQSLNPLSIIILGSVVSYFMRKMGTKYTLMTFGAGLVMALLCFVTLYFASQHYDNNYQINISYLILSMISLAFSELMMAPMMQSIVSFISPKNMRGYMMGFTMLSLSYANIVGGIVLKNLLHIDKTNIKVESLVSITTYQHCFMKISVAFILLSLLYLFLYKTLNKTYLSFCGNAK